MKKLGPAIAAGALALAVSACGSGTSHGNTSGAPLYDKLPQTIKSAGVLKIGGSTSVAPYLYKDGANVTGFEHDLMDAISAELGVKVDFSDTGFAALVPGLQSRKIDVAMGDFSDTKVRQEAVDFVDYTTSYQTLFVQRGNPKKLNSVADLCGMTTAAAIGSISDKLVAQQDSDCKSDGKPGVAVLRMEDAAAATMQVQTARADVVITDLVIGGYVAETGQYGQVVGEPFNEQYHGAAVRKGNDQLRDALTAAFTMIISDGSYGKILEKWKVQKLAMPAPVVNGAKS